MKHAKSPKTTRQTTSNTRQNPSAGKNAISITPPAYGMDFVDRGYAATATLSPPVQLQGDLEEEELLQGKFDPMQLQGDLEEEELLQGKFAPVQRQGDLEEEELLQGKFAPVQLQGDLEEEELLQGKFARNVAPMQFQPTSAPSENRTGMPDPLKAGLEQLSGLDLSGVRVHYNSAKPAQLSALAYTQGQNIEVGPGQERHLPHEGWHVVQQIQGRVKPTLQAKGVSINDDAALEREADVMGGKALQMTRSGNAFTSSTFRPSNRVGSPPSAKEGLRSLSEGQGGVVPAQRVLINNTPANRARNSQLTNAYHASERQGDDVSINSRTKADHERAIGYYAAAVRDRVAAGRLHVAGDQAHEQHRRGIQAIRAKIRMRRSRIRDIDERARSGRIAQWMR